LVIVPSVRHRTGWFPNRIEALTHLIFEKWNLNATVLRHIQENEHGQISELESHTHNWIPPSNSHWIDQKTLQNLLLSNPYHRDTLSTWFTEEKQKTIPPLRAPWETKGWYDEAIDWIKIQLSRMGYTANGQMTQLKGAAPHSFILRIFL